MLAQDTVGEVAEYTRALNQAIMSVRGEMFFHINPPPTITLVADQEEYDLSSITGLARIRGLMMEDTVGDFVIPIPTHHWYLIAGPKLVFEPQSFTPIADRDVRLLAQGVQAVLSSASDALNIDEEYVLARARSILHMNRSLPSGPDQTSINLNASAHFSIAQYWEQLAQRARLTHTYRPDPTSFRVPGTY